MKVGKEMSIKKAKLIIEQINEVIINWELYAEKAGVSTFNIQKIKETHLIF